MDINASVRMRGGWYLWVKEMKPEMFLEISGNCIWKFILNWFSLKEEPQKRYLLLRAYSVMKVQYARAVYKIKRRLSNIKAPSIFSKLLIPPQINLHDSNRQLHRPIYLQVICTGGKGRGFPFWSICIHSAMHWQCMKHQLTPSSPEP